MEIQTLPGLVLEEKHHHGPSSLKHWLYGDKHDRGTSKVDENLYGMCYRKGFTKPLQIQAMKRQGRTTVWSKQFKA
jgi:hypothetical protein